MAYLLLILGTVCLFVGAMKAFNGKGQGLFHGISSKNTIMKNTIAENSQDGDKEGEAK